MASQLSLIEGGCLCGDVRYQSSKRPTLGAYCHCRMCQKAYGGPFQATICSPKHDFRFTRGSPRYYRSSEIAQRGFCDRCGSPLLFHYHDVPRSGFSSQDWPLRKDAVWGTAAHYHTDQRISWCPIDDGLPQWTSQKTLHRDEAGGNGKFKPAADDRS